MIVVTKSVHSLTDSLTYLSDILKCILQIFLKNLVHEVYSEIITFDTDGCCPLTNELQVYNYNI